MAYVKIKRGIISHLQKTECGNTFIQLAVEVSAGAVLIWLNQERGGGKEKEISFDSLQISLGGNAVSIQYAVHRGLDRHTSRTVIG